MPAPLYKCHICGCTFGFPSETERRQPEPNCCMTCWQSLAQHEEDVWLDRLGELGRWLKPSLN